jgi:hypothetical protein
MTSQSAVDDDRIWVERIRQWGLGDVAPVLLDVLRPLGFVGSQLLILAKPVLTTFVDAARLDQLSALLEDPARLERLRQALAREADL